MKVIAIEGRQKLDELRLLNILSAILINVLLVNELLVNEFEI